MATKSKVLRQDLVSVDLLSNSFKTMAIMDNELMCRFAIMSGISGKRGAASLKLRLKTALKYLHKEGRCKRIKENPLVYRFN